MTSSPLNTAGSSAASCPSVLNGTVSRLPSSVGSADLVFDVSDDDLAAAVATSDTPRRRGVAVGRRRPVGRRRQGAVSLRLSSSVGPAVVLSDPVIEVVDDSDDAALSTVAVATSDPLDAVLCGPVLAPVVLGPVPRRVSSVGRYPSPAESHRLLLNRGVTKLYHFTDRSSLPSIQKIGLKSWVGLANEGIEGRKASSALSRLLDQKKGLVTLSAYASHRGIQ